jgi:hypothetical protein
MGEKKRLVMSPKCEVEASYSEQSGLEVELFGEGKSVIKSRQVMPLKEPFAVAGPARNQTAWAVVLKPEN